MALALAADTLQRHVLPSGLTVILEPLPFVRSVALGYSFRLGSVNEPEGLYGATHFLEHLLFKGTPSRSLQQIAREIDELGGEVDAYTGKEYTTFHAHVLDEQTPEALALLTDLVRNPSFNDEDLRMERSVILEEIRMVEDTPDDLIHEIFAEEFWPAHGLGRPILGPPELVRTLTREAIEGHFRRSFTPANMIFCASGNIQPEYLLEQLSRLPAAEPAAHPSPHVDPETRQFVRIVEKPELEQVHLVIGLPGYRQTDDERYAAALFSTILGGGMSSRLFQNVREKEGLVYTISSYHTAHADSGFEAIYAACSTENIRRVIELTIAELRSVRDDGVSEAELAAAKRYVKGSILLSLESTVSRMSAILRQEHYFQRQYTPEEIIERINAVEMEDVRAVARKIVDPEKVAIALLGPLKSGSIGIDDLRGNIEVYS